MVRRGFMAAIGALLGVPASASAQAVEVPRHPIHSRKQDAELERRYGKPHRVIHHTCILSPGSDRVSPGCRSVEWVTTWAYLYGVREKYRGSTYTVREVWDGQRADNRNSSRYIEYADGSTDLVSRNPADHA